MKTTRNDTATRGFGFRTNQPSLAPAPKVAAAPRQLQTRWLVGVAALVLLGGLLLLVRASRCTQATPPWWCWLGT